MPQKKEKPFPTILKLRVVTVILVFFFAGMGLVLWMMHRADQQMREDLLKQARLVAQLLNIGRIHELSGTEADLGTSDYLRLKEQLSNARRSNNKCRFAYLMGRRADGEVFFFVDSEPVGSEDESPAGQVYEEVSEGYRRVFETKIAEVDGPVTDRWGVWVTALVPVIDPATDELMAVLGMDIYARAWKWDVAAHAAVPGGILIALLLMAVSWVIAARLPAIATAKPIQYRLMIPLATVLFLLIGAFGVLQVKQQKDGLNQSSIETLEEVSGDMKILLAEQSRTLDALGQVLLLDTGLREALKDRDRERLLANYEQVFLKLRGGHGITHFYFVGTDRVCLLRVHKPGKHGDLIDRFTMREAERTGMAAVGLELGPLGTFLSGLCNRSMTATHASGTWNWAKRLRIF
jgi:hypothetical protein